MRITPASRPYWHVDAKWICGLLFIFVFCISLVLYSLSRATDASRGPKIAALAIGTGFIRGNTVDTQDARKALAEHGGVIKPLPNVPSITITEADLKLTPAQISLKVFQPITESIYLNGIEATADKYAPNTASKERFKKDASLLQLFTKEVHQKVSNFATILFALSCLFAAGVVYFSARWGRLANMGLLLVLATLPGAFLGFALANTPENANSGAVASAIGVEAGKILSQTYSKFMIAGVLLLAAALVGRMYSAIMGRKRQAETNSEKATKQALPRR